MAELRATPYANPLTGLSNDVIQGLLGYMKDKQRTQQMQGLASLLESTGIPKTVERAAYAESPTGLLNALTNVNRANVPLLKPETADALMTLAPVPSGANKAAMAVGRAGERYAERVVPQIMERGGLPASLLQDLAQGTKSQIFIGSKSKAWNKDAAELAKKLEKDGESPELIWEKTGTFKSPDGKWRQEISDQNIELRSKKIGVDLQGNPIIMSTTEGKAYQVMEHPELYNAYPFTRKIETEIGNKPVTSGATEYGDEGRFLEAYGPTNEDIKSALVHEMQHQVQNREGMASGSGFMAGDKEDFQRYLRAAGEAEARAVQARRNLSMEERRKLFPLSSYDVPIKELDTSLPQKEDFGFFKSLLDVWHGSPHKFPPTTKNPLGEFDASKIGTGEGAQVYGHGIYTAENPKVGAEYKLSLAGEDKGYLYKADLPDEQIAKMLDYDKTWKQQPQNVQDAINVDKLLKYYGTDDISTSQVLYHAKQNMSPAAFAEFLRSKGVPGIKYLDEGSRAEGQGTRNFVVFPGEEKSMTILERNGLLADQLQSLPEEKKKEILSLLE